MRVAVIGGGISGNLVAHLLQAEHDVHLYESATYAGGHTCTVEVELDGIGCTADVGFMVFNERTYPNFVQLLRRLQVPSQPSDMSFSVCCQRTGLEYQGSSLNGLFAQRANILRPRFLRMLSDICRFNRVATKAAASGQLDDGTTVRDFLADCRVGAEFERHYLVPMVAAIWSARPAAILDYPARFLVGFLRNHGLLQLRDRPQWQTIPGGARRYVRRLLEPLGDRVRLGCQVARVRRQETYVEVTPFGGAAERFDRVVVAAHADQALGMLSDASTQEREILSAFPYQANEAVLHTDVSLLPRRRRAWASWNYHLADAETPSATVTYDLSRLQRLPVQRPLLLTLNRSHAIAPQTILRRFSFAHPAYTQASIAAQRRFDEINAVRRTYFCGAYWGYGFHEDGVKSALAVARYFGKDLESCTAACTPGASCTPVTGP